MIGEEQKSQVEHQEAEKLGPKEDASKMRDCTARQNHDEHNNILNASIYKQEKEDGTQLNSINLSGSQFDFEFMLDH
eukprot:9940613-Heterocapsa_arctica.AAC.1